MTSCAKYFSIAVTDDTSCITNPSSLPDGEVGALYNVQLLAPSLSGPLVFSVVSGDLPYGLTLSESGLISGITESPLHFSFRIKVLDVNNNGCEKDFTLDGIKTPTSCNITTPYVLPDVYFGGSVDVQFEVANFIGVENWLILGGGGGYVTLSTSGHLTSGVIDFYSQIGPFALEVRVRNVFSGLHCDKTFTFWINPP